MFLSQISNYLRIPDIHKERSYHIEQGLKFLKIAVEKNEYYEDAIKSFEAALVIEPKDFFSLYRKGIIYLFSPNHLNINEAIECFMNSFKYASAESFAYDGVNKENQAITNVLLSQFDEYSKADVSKAESAYYCSYCNNILGNYEESIKWANTCLEILPDFFDACRIKAKSMISVGQIDEAVILLQKYIEKDRYFTLKIASDVEMVCNNKVIGLLESLTHSIKIEVEQEVSQIKKLKSPVSITNERLEDIDKFISIQSYLSLLKAKDLLNNFFEYKFTEIVSDDGFRLTSASYYLTVKDAVINENNNKILKGELSKYLTADEKLVSKYNEISQQVREANSIINESNYIILTNKKLSRDDIIFFIALPLLFIVVGLNGFSSPESKDEDSNFVYGCWVLILFGALLFSPMVYNLIKIFKGKNLIDKKKSEIEKINPEIKELEFSIQNLKSSYMEQIKIYPIFRTKPLDVKFFDEELIKKQNTHNGWGMSPS